MYKLKKGFLVKIHTLHKAAQPTELYSSLVNLVTEQQDSLISPCLRCRSVSMLGYKRDIFGIISKAISEDIGSIAS